MQRLSNNLFFVRHVPLSKLASRLALTCKRQTLSRLPRLSPHRPSSDPGDGRGHALRPLFAARNACWRSDGKDVEVTFLGVSRQIRTPIDWHSSELATGTRLWKLNLHYMEFLEAADDAAFAEIVTDWIRANPPFEKEYWLDSWNSFALSIRVVVWMQQLALRGDRLASSTAAAMRASLLRQMRFLEANLETDIGGNHLIKNIKALIWASAFFSGPDADRWRELGLRLLRKELARQILPDGVHYERSPSYHCQVFADLLECRQALNEDPLNGAFDDALARMAQACVDLSHSDDRVAQFNDSGLSMAYGPAQCLDVYERLFGRRPTRRDVFAFSNAGYFGLWAEGAYFIADCGRIGPDDLPAHAHGDISSFEYSFGNRRLIVDQGVFEYNPGERRDMSRSAKHHNTLCFEGADQAEFFESFRCGRRPNVTIRLFERTADGFVLEGAHDGFARLPGAPVHVRKFSVTPAQIEICDRIEGRTDRPASIGFLLHPEAKVEAAGNVAWITSGAVALRMRWTQPIEVEDAVWWPDMGREESTKRLRVRLEDGEGVTTELRVVSRSADE
jgi:uncharacterized heparinase superfamily protein